MHISRRTTVALLLAVILLTAGCGGEADQTSGDDVLEAADREAIATTTTTIDPWAVPDPIDGAYVQRVITEIAEVESRVRRDVWGTQQFDGKSKERLAAIYDDPFLTAITHSFSEGSMKEHPEYKPNPGPAKTSVVKLVTGRRDCIFVLVSDDDSENRLTPSPPSNWGITLRPSAPNVHNKTRWKEVDWRSIDGYEPVDECVK